MKTILPALAVALALAGCTNNAATTPECLGLDDEPNLYAVWGYVVRSDTKEPLAAHINYTSNADGRVETQSSPDGCYATRVPISPDHTPNPSMPYFHQWTITVEKDGYEEHTRFFGNNDPMKDYSVRLVPIR